MASRNGRLSMSPTVPPISHSTKSSSERSAWMNSLMASVTCGMTCTVAPRYAPRRDAGVALVMAEIEIGLRPIVGDIDLAMLVGAHRARIDIEVGVELT